MREMEREILSDGMEEKVWKGSRGQRAESNP